MSFFLLFGGNNEGGLPPLSPGYAFVVRNGAYVRKSGAYVITRIAPPGYVALMEGNDYLTDPDGAYLIEV
jgi:hypothetical protein